MAVAQVTDDLNTGQQIGGSIGTALLNTVATSAIASYIAGLLSSHPALAAHSSPAATQAAQAAAAVHGYTTAFWWAAAIFAGGGIICGAVPMGTSGCPAPGQPARRPG